MGISQRYHFFIAHAAADISTALELYNQLTDLGYRVFMDENDLLPGDKWDKEITQAQQNSLATIIIISENTDTAYYEKEEIINAIEFSRQPDSFHRVVPVLVEEYEYSKIPYGLKRVQSIRKQKNETITDVTKRIKHMMDVLGQNDEKYLPSFDYIPKVLLKSVLMKLGLTYGRYNAIRKKRKEDNFNKWAKNYIKKKFLSFRNKSNVYNSKMLANRKVHQAIENELKEEIETILIGNNLPFIILIDIDGTTSINKYFSHKVGTRVISTIHDLIVRCPDAKFVKKIGADEFLCCLSSKDITKPYRFAEKIRELISTYQWEKISLGLYVTVSVGLVEMKISDADQASDDFLFLNRSRYIAKKKIVYEDINKCIIRAIFGCRTAKKNGGNCVETGPEFLPSFKRDDYVYEYTKYEEYLSD